MHPSHLQSISFLTLYYDCRQATMSPLVDEIVEWNRNILGQVLTRGGIPKNWYRT